MYSKDTTLSEQLTPELRTYLEGWYASSKKRQEERHRIFDLSFDDFIDLWTARRLATLQRHLDDGSVYRRMNGENPFGFVLTWVSYAAKQTGVMNKETAQVCIRSKSVQDNKMKKGDTHTPEAKAKISRAKTGNPHSENHKAAISNAMKGRKRGPMSEAEKAKRSATQKANWEARRVAKQASQAKV